MRILIPVDGSKASEHAVGELIKYLPQWREAPQLELLYVQLPVRPSPTIHGVSIDGDALGNYYRKEAETATAKAKEMLTTAKLAFSEAAAIGEPAEQVCKTAAEKKCDMIWMGTRGMGGFANLLLGSVAMKVLHRASIPVTLVPMHSEK